MRVKNGVQGALAGVLFGSAVLAAGSAYAGELTWSTAGARVAQCAVGSCGTPGAINVLDQETFSGSNTDVNASVHVDDYRPHVTPHDYGNAFASAEGGDGDLSLPVLHAYARGAVVNATAPLTVSVNNAWAQGVQGFTNTTDNALLIPLNAFVGVVDYQMFGPGLGAISAALALTTDAITDPSVANQWFSNSMAPGMMGQFAATCGTTGALALGNPTAVSHTGPTALSYLTVATSSCTGQDTFLLAPGETFYMWARLTVLRSGFGATDAANTFNIQFSPEAAPELRELLALSLVVADGANIAPGVPEPATWAMLILGFGGVGSILRRRRTTILA